LVNSLVVQLVAEESRVDEPELGKPELDKLETIGEGMRTTTSFTTQSDCFHLLVNLNNSHKVFIDFRHFSFQCCNVRIEKEVIELDDSLRWAKVSQSLW
nr:hypothetical protein [Tanacetum cinerariifolium]